jgi:DNA-directed RNA polymerase subunit M/transcription elongation factor TFIIS|tara:strand:+ start:91 stop:342 length:252 start_codon:yes stop_codon:yes gene_type:complete
MFCPQCRSQEIINKDITPIYECFDCGYMFNEDNLSLYEGNVVDYPEEKQSFTVLEFIFDKNDLISSVILIYLVVFPFLLGFLI